MKILLVRHGETQFNAENRYLGFLDPELNGQGISEALELQLLLPSTIDAVITSPLRRARQTAEFVCKPRTIEPIIDAAFAERNVGVFEGLTQEEARTRYPDLWAENVTRVWHGAPTNGETIAAVVARVTEGLARTYAIYKGRTVVIVAHGFVAKVVRAISLSNFDDFFEWKLSNGAICELWLDQTDRPVS